MALGRPPEPLLSRDRIVRAALKIVDEEGLDALTTRRLADALGVKGASLYNHFSNKEEIVLAAAEYALGGPPEKMIEGNPEVLLVLGARALRDALLAHPALVPVQIRQRSTGMANGILEPVARRLIEDGVPVDRVVLLFESLERFAIGTAIREIGHDDVWELDPTSAEKYPYLAIAAGHVKSAHDSFDIVVAGIVRGIMNACEFEKVVSRSGRQKLPN